MKIQMEKNLSPYVPQHAGQSAKAQEKHGLPGAQISFRAKVIWMMY